LPPNVSAPGLAESRRKRLLGLLKGLTRSSEPNHALQRPRKKRGPLSAGVGLKQDNVRPRLMPAARRLDIGGLEDEGG